MADLRARIEAIWRIESPRILGRLARMLRDLGQAEDLAHDSVLAALETWPRTGVPENPGAWLMTTARNRAIDAIRRAERYKQKLAEHAAANQAATNGAAPYGDQQSDRARGSGTGDPAAWASHSAADPQSDWPEDFLQPGQPAPDDILGLMFATCHPVLSLDARASLCLKILGGLSTAEIARAYFVKEQTIAQRIVRAKRSLSQAGVAFEVPAGRGLTARLDSVLEVIYLVFNEGYSASSGSTLLRPQLCDEAMRLGRMLATRLGQISEVHGLLALMEIQASRLPARMDADGKPVLLAQQNRSKWDQLLIRRGLSGLDRARTAAERQGSEIRLGTYALQAEIAACHARARIFEDTDWGRIAELYAELGRRAPSPIVELNRAVALSMAQGPEAGLRHLSLIENDPALRDYYLLPAVRGDFLLRQKRSAEAATQFRQAAALCENEAERQLLLNRAAEADCGLHTD